MSIQEDRDKTPSSANLPKPTVLVVDDEEAVRSSVRRALLRVGYRVLEACNLDEAVREFRKADPKVDVVLLDMVLPGGGPNVFRQLREADPDVPVIVSSGFMGEHPGSIAALRAEDRVELLPKPYELMDLYRMVGRALNMR